MQDTKILTAGDSSVLIQFGNTIDPEINYRISATVQMMREQHIIGVTDIIPAFCSLLINYDPRVISFAEIKERMEGILKMEIKAGAKRKKVYEIPVCYGGEYGPDLQFVARHAGLRTDEVIRLHSAPSYLIYMMGFMPGFTYLGGLDERLHTPRLSAPRVRIPAGSVGIGGEQTGIYPMESPGGWQLIGRTPLCLFAPGRALPYAAGDSIHFVPVDEREFARIAAQEREGCA